MTDMDRALDDLDAAELRALAVAAHETRQRSLDDGFPRRAALWHAFAVAVAEAKDRQGSTLRALEDDLLGLLRSEDG